MRIALGIEYDGSAFNGWQAQLSGVRTLQGAVEQALSAVAAHPVSVVCAGRTDTGVHATGQVVHFDSDAPRSPRAWTLGTNTLLPPDVSVRWAQPVAETFHARFSATARQYRYIILNQPTRPALLRNRAVWQMRPLDVERMNAAAAHLIGEHDFSAYRAQQCQSKSPVRVMRRLTVTRYGDYLSIDVLANAFLHHMVRNIAGVLMTIGHGEREPDWAREVLEGRDRKLGGVTAPPQGLYLVAVEYPAEFALPATPESATFIGQPGIG
jgi:tRNA pseudouridine38-40 synthase